MRFFLLAAALVAALPAGAQGVFKFDAEAHDFKNVAEGTMATREFKFTNVGNQPIVIANVQASCGCTTPEWSKTPVPPGKTGFVKAVYNSNGRPGVFNKTITITSNADKPSLTLSIKGTVLTRDEMRKAATPEQLAKSPKLTISGSNEFAVGKLEANRPGNAHFTVQNTGKQPLVLNGLYSACNCVSYKQTPDPIAPGESTTIQLTYSPREVGEKTEVVTLYSNDLTQTDVVVKLKANVVSSLVQGSMLRESDNRVPFK